MFDEVPDSMTRHGLASAVSSAWVAVMARARARVAKAVVMGFFMIMNL